MEKMTRFDAKELFEGFKELNQMEINEIYKALIAYSVDADEYTPEVDSKLDEVIDYYFDNDHIGTMINDNIFDKATDLLNM